MKTYPCVHCGFCCSRSACSYGRWDSNLKRCTYLVEKDKRFYCGKFDEISKDPNSYWEPAFGEGCCSSLFNTYREDILREKLNGKN